jgi:hypothetical protein
MRGIAKAVLAAIGVLSGASAIAGDLPTKKPAPEPVVTPTLPSSWHFEITGSAGARTSPAKPAWDHFPPHRSTSISSSFSNISRAD